MPLQESSAMPRILQSAATRLPALASCKTLAIQATLYRRAKLSHRLIAELLALRARPQLPLASQIHCTTSLALPQTRKQSRAHFSQAAQKT